MNTQSKFSLTKGYSFWFEHESNSIELWFSSITGSEKVFVNDQLIEKRRNFFKNSSICFQIQGDSYESKMEIKDFLRGPFVCSLFKNDKLIGKQQLLFREPNQKPAWFVSFWFYLFVGVFLGICAGVLDLPFPLVAVVIGTLVLSSGGRFPGQMKPRIEDLDILKDNDDE